MDRLPPNSRRKREEAQRWFSRWRVLAGLCTFAHIGMANQSPTTPLIAQDTHQAFDHYTLDFTTPVDAALQTKLESLDALLRERYGIGSNLTAVGLLDLKKLQLAMIHPDHIEYGASVPKIGILLAWFQLHPEAARQLEPAIRHELGLMIKVSSNEMAAKYSREL